MGEAYRGGEVTATAQGDTKEEVLRELLTKDPDADEIRIRSQRADRVNVERLTAENVEAAFHYQPWDGPQQAAGEAVRQSLIVAAALIIEMVPDTPLRTRALNNLIDSRMLANAAITFKGRF